MEAVEYVRSVMTPMQPDPTGWKPSLKMLPQIKVIVFDIYGTLIQSAAGDISLVTESSSEIGMRRAIDRLGLEWDGEVAPWIQQYHDGIQRQQDEARKNGVNYPEIEIRKVWSILARELGSTKTTTADCEAAAIRYECAVNPSWAMPGADKVVADLALRSVPVGILSNAQFYTRTVVEAAFGSDWNSFGFDPGLCLFSFEEGQSKPSHALFEKMRGQVEAHGYTCKEVLYLGNDVRKDIKPACEVGFRTGLFAGDGRSLRVDSGGEAEARSCADVVLTEWSQFDQILP